MEFKDSSSDIETIQKIALDMLSFFKNYAQENNLTFYLSGGTLLGAVRHQGFIPWDDDVDLMMPREDYNRLINSFEDSRYKLSCCENDSDYNTPTARLWDPTTKLEWPFIKDKPIGVFIDIFPIDGFPKGGIKTKLHLQHLKILRTFINASNRKEFLKGEKYKSLKLFLHKFIRHNGNFYSRRLNIIAQKYSYLNSKYVGVKTTTDHLFRERNSKTIFEETILLPFENLMLPAPSGYDVYLSHLYGNYMQMPPVDKRCSIHQFKIYLNEMIYN